MEHVGRSEAGAMAVTADGEPMDESDLENHFKSEFDGEGDDPSVEFTADDDEGVVHHLVVGGGGSSDVDYEEDDEDEDDNSDAASSSQRSVTQRRRRSRASGDASVLEASAAARCTEYVADPSEEVFGTASDQTEEISEENKSIVWFLVKQVRPGMDLSKVVLPTFILEPRSFLDKLTDYHYHDDLLSM